MSLWSNRSVRTKLSLATMAACAAALAMVSGGVVLNELFSVRAQLTARIQSVGDVIAATSRPAVQFTDAAAAAEALTALKGDASIEGARIELPNGTVLFWCLEKLRCHSFCSGLSRWSVRPNRHTA